MKENVKLKIKEALSSIVPITLIVAILSFTITPLATDVIVEFIIGAIMLVIGTGFFTLGAEMSMSIIGERIGADIAKRKNIFLILAILIILGTVVTIAEPDLKVLAEQITSVPSNLIIGVVGLGVGVFLSIAFLRVVLKIKLKYALLFFYSIVFVLAFFVPKEFLAMAFDSGGATTGPMAVPFIIAFGIGISSIRSEKNSESDSFGMVALCSIGPILATMILGMVYKITNFEYTNRTYSTYANTKEIAEAFVQNLPNYFGEVVIALLPIIIFFIIYQLAVIKMSKKELFKVFIGCFYEFIGLTLFLLGANVGFLQIGSLIGMKLAEIGNDFLIIAIGALLGYFVVIAEPAVEVLNKQISDITDGAIPEKAMKKSLSIGVSIALVISMIRVLTGIPILYFLLPGYLIALILAFVGDDIFTAVAFDSGGVASGTMASAFLVPFAIGVSEGVGGNVLSDAFGVIAMVAMAPIVAVQISGLIYKLKSKKLQKKNGVGGNEEQIIEVEWM